MARKPVLENAVMEILWDETGPLTAGQVRSRLPETHPVAYTTVMTVLTRLWEKGRLRRYRVGRAYSYVPTHGREQAAALRMQEILGKAKSRASTLGRFVEHLDSEDREQLRQKLAMNE